VNTRTAPRLAALLAVRAPRRSRIDKRCLHALALLLLFVQLPHLTHLPLWVGALGGSIVALRLLELHRPGSTLRARLLSPLALSGLAALAAIAIRADYGYFIGRDPCVAFLSVLVAAKFAEVRRAGDATMLLCLAAFLLLTQYFYSQTILAALVTLPAVLALGHALAVLRDPADPSPVGARLRLVAVLLAQGLPIAALLFLVFPRLPGPLWSLPEDSVATSGLSDTMEPGSIAALSRSAEVAFRVEFDPAAGGGVGGDEAIPPSRLRYWRGPVLDAFDGRRWSESGIANGSSEDAASGLASDTGDGERIDYIVMLQPHRQRWLFALERPSSLPRAPERSGADSRPLARVTADGRLIAEEPVTQVLRYRQSSVPGATLPSTERPHPVTLELGGNNPRSAALATRLRARAEDEWAYARSVLAHFNREPFRYTLTPQLLGDAPIDEFLFDTRAGFCEHYAAAFVTLMRAGGVPARVVTGYLGGEMNGDYMIVRQSDAHAWAEAWVEGAWRRFDPTGEVAPSRIETGLAAALPDSVAVPRLARTDSGWLKIVGLRWDAVNHAWQRFVVDFDDDSQAKLWRWLGLAEPALWQLAVAVLAGAGLWCLAVLGLPRRHGALTRAPVERAWARFGAALARRGIERAPSESPHEYVTRAASLLPRERARVERLGRTLVALRFARPDEETDPARLAGVRRELRAFALAGLGGLGGRRRGRRTAPEANGAVPESPVSPKRSASSDRS